MSKSKAQVAIEFLLLTGFSVICLLVFVLILSKIASDNSTYILQTTVQDFGLSLKNEFTVASEMENGYTRDLNLPNKLNGKTYAITIDESLSGNSYLLISSGLVEMYFDIPKTTGTLSPGNNRIIKNENLTVTHIP